MPVNVLFMDILLLIYTGKIIFLSFIYTVIWSHIRGTMSYLADPDKASGCFTNNIVITYLFGLVSNTFSQLCLECRQAQTVMYNRNSHESDYVTQV